MKGSAGLVLALASLGLAASVDVTPVQKAVQMLEGMLVTTKKAKHEENVQFAGFKEFCDNTQVSKAGDIKEGAAQIESLSASIEKAKSDIKSLATKIGKQEAALTQFNVDVKTSTKMRDEQRANYLKDLMDLQESVDAISEAMRMLKQQDRDVAAKSLLQLSALSRTPDDAKEAIQTFLQAPDRVAPGATAYKFQSGAIIDMLEKLQGKFRKEKTELEAKEVEDRQTYDMLLQDRTDSIADAENSIEEMTKTKADTNVRQSKEEGDLKEVTDVWTEDTKYREDLVALCDQKSDEFKSRTKLRDDEITALQAAVDILGSDKVGDADTRVQAFVQVGSSFAQLRSAAMAPNQRVLIDFLKTESVRLGSHELSALAMAAAADPFLKVKQLISELINRLKSQATAEATQKGWCDKEMGTNKHTRETKSAEVDTLTAQIEGLTANIAKLGKEIAKKGKEVTAIETAVAEFSKKRAKEQASNAAAVKDAKAGQAAIGQAVKVLKDFYAKAAKATVLAQKTTKDQPKVPEIFDGAYKGEQASTGGVLGMLDVIKSDFARLEADTNSAEQAAQAEFDSFMSDSAQTKAVLEVDLKHCKTNKMGDEGELSNQKTELESAQSILKGALDSYEKLKVPCEKEPMSYAERKGRREQEVESLKQALELLSADNLPSA